MTRSTEAPSGRGVPVLSAPLLALIALLAAFLSLGLGRYGISPAELLRALVTPVLHYYGADVGADPTAVKIVWDVRLPRILTALFAGGGLAAAGAALQGVFRNPLVDPHIIGVTAGSAFGGALGILAGLPILFMMGSAFATGLLALGLVCWAAFAAGREDRLMIVLAGIIIAGVFSALVSLVQYSADAEETLPSIVFWLMGSFASANWPKALWSSGVIVLALAVLMRLRWRINLLSLDEKDAAALGVQTRGLRRAVLTLCAVVTAAQVSVSGAVGWVGLVVPHLARLIVGADHRRLLPAAFWLGGAFMILVDDAARTLTAAEIPLGILTALAGAPVFGALLIRSRRMLRE